MVASSTGEISTGRPMASASACDEHVVVRHAAVDAQRADRVAAVRLGRLDQVGAAVGHALEDGPDDLGPTRAPGQPDQGAPGAEVPHRRAQAEEGRDEPDVTRGLALGGDGRGLLGGGEDPEVVAQPLDAGARPRA